MYYRKTCYDCVWDGPECWHGTGIKTKLNTDFSWSSSHCTLQREVVPGMWMPSYLMSISCRPASVGAYLTVTVPSLLSVMSGLATLPDGIRTSPSAEDRNTQWGLHNTDYRPGFNPSVQIWLCYLWSLLSGWWTGWPGQTVSALPHPDRSFPLVCLLPGRQRVEVRHTVCD